MKRFTILLCAVVLSAITFSVFAQDIEQTETNVNKSKNNWFISLGGAASMLQGEQDHVILSVSERIRFSGEFSVGKWFNPFFGARVQFMGGALKGANYISEAHPLNPTRNQLDGYYTTSDRSISPYPKGNSNWNHSGIKLITGKGKSSAFLQEFNYGAAAIDLMGNLNNLIRGYWGQENKVDVIPYAGFGVVHARPSVTNPSHTGVLGRMGVRANVNLSKKWAIYLEPQVNWVSSEFDGYVGHRVADMFGNLFLGVQYTINKDYSNPASILSLDEVNYLNDRINENRGLIENQQGILERQQNLIDRLDGRVTTIEKTPVVVQRPDHSSFLPEYIRFTLDSYKIPSSEQNKVNDAIAFLKANPDSKLLLVGYADKKTGNSKHNLSLSRNRVEAVAAELRNRGINSNRIIQEWKGDQEQPFAQNDWNRVVVLVERK